MKKILLSLLLAFATPALSQDGPNHAVPVFGGAGFSGFRAVGPCTNAQVLGWAAGVVGDPSCGALPIGAFPALTGDVTTPAGSVATTISNNVVSNAKLAQMPANTIKGNNTASTANALDLTVAQAKTLLGVSVSVTDPAFGAVCDGSADDTTAIQNAINSLPASGGTVLFPVANCKITNTIQIGNGNSTTLSTKRGVILRGVGNPSTPAFFLGGWTVTTGPKLTWAGSAGGTMLQISGPLQGWGIENLYLDCVSSANVGLFVSSGQFGDVRNLTISLCMTQGIQSNTVPLFGAVNNTDSFHNNWQNINILVPANAGAMGILLTGSAATSDTDVNQFINVSIGLPPTLLTHGVYLQVADSNVFYGLHFFGGSATARAVSFDYAVSGNFPASNTFYNVDQGGTTLTGWTNSGTPAAGATPNYIYGLVETNGGVAPVLNNLAVYSSHAIVTSPGGNNAGTNILGAWTAFTPAYTCGTATFTNNTSRRLTMGKTTFIQIDVTITAIGTCTNNLSFTLPNTAQSSGALNGMETTNSGKGTTCAINGGSATASTCKRADATNLAVNDRIVASGVYENQ